MSIPMKKFMKSFLVALTVLLIMGMSVSAAPQLDATTKTLSTNYTLVNMGSATANVVASYYKPDGTVWAADAGNQSFTITKDFGQAMIRQYFDGTMTAGYGSVVISSDQPLGSVVQIMARNQVNSTAAYTGISKPSNKYYVPQVFKNRSSQSGTANSVIYIQNADSTVVSATVDFVPSPLIAGLSPFSKPNISIPIGSVYKYDLSNETGLADGWVGSLVISAASNKNLAVVVNSFAGPDYLVANNAFSQEEVAGASSWAVPQFVSRLNNGLSTNVIVQNMSGSTMVANSIEMNCTAIDGGGFTPATITLKNTVDVVNNSTFVWNPVADFTIPSPWSGSCRVVAPGPIAVIGTFRSPYVNNNGGNFECFRSDSTDTKVVIPLMSKRLANGFATVATIQNLDANNPADVKLTYTPSQDYINGGGSSTPIIINKTIPKGGNIDQNFRFSSMVPEVPDLWYGTLTITAQNQATARPIVAIVQNTNILNPAGDSLGVYKAFTLP